MRVLKQRHNNYHEIRKIAGYPLLGRIQRFCGTGVFP
jgi:hypothetical protein